MSENEMIDPVMMCIYCGETMDVPNEKQIKIFGFPNCCEEDMLKIERNKLFKIVKGLDSLKTKLEAEILRGMI